MIANTNSTGPAILDFDVELMNDEEHAQFLANIAFYNNFDDEGYPISEEDVEIEYEEYESDEEDDESRLPIAPPRQNIEEIDEVEQKNQKIKQLEQTIRELNMKLAFRDQEKEAKMSYLHNTATVLNDQKNQLQAQLEKQKNISQSIYEQKNLVIEEQNNVIMQLQNEVRKAKNTRNNFYVVKTRRTRVRKSFVENGEKTTRETRQKTTYLVRQSIKTGKKTLLKKLSSPRKSAISKKLKEQIVKKN